MTGLCKRIIAVLFISSVLFCMVACASKSNQGQLTVKEGTLTVATNAQFPPYEFWEDNKIIGIDADIAQKIADKLGMELKIEDVSFDSLITGIQSNKYDLAIAGMTITDERRNSVSFTDTYAEGVQVIVVKDGSKIDSADTLKNGKYKVGVQIATTGDLYISDDIGEDRVEKYNTVSDAVQALLSDRVDAVVVDEEPARTFVDKNSNIKIINTEYVREEYAIAVGKKNNELLDKVNKAIEELKEDGTIDSILDKYIHS